ncbi:PIN domain-containing protein [Deinococcus sp. YIM 134068]|uniref:type II toxin-antitoxin system VapC family toxin n=1 Tax=Deinococcus lichenicola TaxID=3118910 RepID=UPI002F95B699
MKVIVDSNVWFGAIRKRTGEPSPELRMLSDLVREGRVQMLGCIRQEVLQGLHRPEVFERIRQSLRALPDREASFLEYELAAAFFNTCRGEGIQGSSTDFLIAACSVTWGLPLLTKDKDFQRYAEHVPLEPVKV